MKTITAEQFRDLYGDDGMQMFSSPEQSRTSFGADLKGDIRQIGTDIVSSTKGRSANFGRSLEAQKRGEQTFGETASQFIGQGAGLASDVFGGIVKGGVKAVLPQSAEEGVKTALSAVTKPIMESTPVQALIEKYNTLDDRTKRNIDAALGLGSLTLDVALGGVGKRGVQTGVKTATETGAKIATKTGEMARPVVQSIKTGAEPIVEAAGKLLKKEPISATKAVGEIIQGQTGDIVPAVKSLSSIETKGVKTFSDLDKQLTTKITDLRKVVDDALSQDGVIRKIDDIKISAQTTGGKTVESNPVKQALEQLAELYDKTGDPLRRANIEEIITRGNSEGLSNLDVNNIARLYGSELGTKAFSKLGDPLTSVNAQMYENTRKALKTVARSGIKGKVAKEADELMSSMLNTRILVQRNIEAVNKLRQRIQNQSRLAKVGSALAKYGDMLTGGSIRGFIGGLLPRGAGYKVMNALDIEEALIKNLKILEDAVKSGTDDTLNKILKF